MFRDLKGMDVEYIVNDVARDGKKIWGSRDQDSEGSQLFQALVFQLAQYPDVTAFSSLRELLRKGNTVRGDEPYKNLKWSLERSQLLAKVLLQMCSSNSLGQDAELLDALCQNASMLSPKDVNLGFSVRIEPRKTKDPGDVTGETRVVQRSRNGQGQQDGESASSGSFAGTLPEKILRVFDDMLYLIERDKTSKLAKKPLEAKFLEGWCMFIDACLVMATQKKKQERWRSRRMPAGPQEVAARMHELGIESAWKAPLLAFLFVWKGGWGDGNF